MPKFNERDERHLRLAALSELAHQKASEFLRTNPPEHELTATRLGRYRIDIKAHLADEMKEIDSLVEKMIG